MASEQVERVAQLVAEFLPEDRREQLLNSLRFGLTVVEQHGDAEGFARLVRDVEAAALALRDGDVQAALHILDEWGVMAWLPVGLVEQVSEASRAGLPAPL